MTTYTFSIWQFDDREINQITGLFSKWLEGTLDPADRRKLTDNVEHYARNWGLLTWDEQHKRLRYSSRGIDPRYDLPVEALWRLVEPMLNKEGSTGYSITKRKGWEKLNIWPAGDRSHSELDIREMEEIFLHLSVNHYVNFQMAGDVWCIHREDKEQSA